MNVKKEKKYSIVLELIMVALVALLLIHTYTIFNQTNIVDSSLVDLTFKHVLNNPFEFEKSKESALFTFIFAGMFYALYKTYQLRNKRNRQDETYGSSEWGSTDTIKHLKEKELTDNLILTKNEYVSYDMRKTNLNRNIALIGSPGTGKSRYFFKPNILNCNGSMIITDPKGELVRDTGMALIRNGYRVKVLNLDNMFISDHYNPLNYIKKMPSEAYELLDDGSDFKSNKEMLREDDVMSLINLIMRNTDGDKKNTGSTSDPFWEKAEMLLLQSCFFYVLFRMRPEERHLTSVIKLLKFAKKEDDEEKSALDMLFDKWKEEEPNHIGVKQYEHYKSSNEKMEKTIIMTAVARMSVFNIEALEKVTSDDTLELDKLGASGEDGKLAIFIVTKPSNPTFNFLATLVYTQAFQLLDANAEKAGGSLPTQTNLYIDEFANIGEIPRFLETLAYVRGLNVGVTFAIQSLDQLKKIYKDDWETALDCCDYILFLGAKSKSTLQWVSEMLGKKTWYKKSSSQTFGSKGSNSASWDVVGRELAFMDEIRKMKKGHAILIAGEYDPFYSELFDITKHPNYPELYEPWNDKETAKNRYNHSDYLSRTLAAYKTQSELKNIGIDGKLVDLVPQGISLKELKKLKLLDPDTIDDL